jgi:tetratricopeptide (TPR) repeat protein
MQQHLAQGLAEGWEAIKRDDVRAAEQIARGALGRDPQQVEFLYLLGSSLLFQDRFQEALGPLSEVVQRSPRRGAGHRLGYCLLALGDVKAAEQLLRRELESYPDLIDAYNALGVALIRQSRPQDALQVFLEAARRDPRSATANNNVANVLGDLGRHEEALPYLRKVIEADPKLAEAHHNLGMLYQNLKRHEEAAASLAQALRLAPGTSYTPGYLVWNRLSSCSWEGLAGDIESLRAGVRARQAAADPFTCIAVSDSPQEQRLCAELYIEKKLPRSGRGCKGGANAAATTGSAWPTCRRISTSTPPPSSRHGSSSCTSARSSSSSASPTGPTTAVPCAAGCGAPSSDSWTCASWATSRPRACCASWKWTSRST